MKPIALLLIVGMFASLAGAQTATPPPVPPATPAPAKPAVAGTPAPAAPGAAAAAPANPNTPPDKPPLTPAELEQLLATIALYPDSLLTQILMASTYPLEIVQADRWAKENKSLTGDALATALEKQPWDPSVKSLINFPQVLAMMNDKLDLTIKMGDAFIEQQSDVMNTIQKLRAKANATGNLKSNEQQKVIIEQAPPATQQTTVVVEQAPPQVPPQPQVIVIQPAQPNVIYVPTYSPTVVYGVWAYPAYPPYPYYPPNYVASNVVAFGAGVAVGAAWGYAWGNSNWNSGDVDINVNRNTNINNKIDRSKYQQNINNRQNNRQANGAGANRGSWQHDPSHRQGVPYRDNKTASQYGRGNGQAAQARDQYRGRADAGRQDLNRGGASDFRGTGGDFSGGAGNRGGAGAGAAGAGNRGNAGAGGAGGAGANRPSATPSYRGNSSPSSGSRGSAMNGVGGGGSSARQSSQRGQASRSSSGYSGGGGSRGGGGGSRGGGGGSRGGGGGRGRSDVNLKSDFASVDPNTVLEKVANLPITTWNYKDDPESRHLGPMAQDFYRAFGIGSDDKTITFLDEGGVALSAIQGLNQKLDERDARIKALEREVAELKALVQKLADKPSAGAASKN